MIAVGQTLPAGKVMESTEFDASNGCPMPPKEVDVLEAVKGKKVVIFGLPGAFTPTCSAKHLPGFIAAAAKFKDKKVDEIWCVSVNDAFVMGAWGKEQGAKGKVRMMADGSGLFSKALGLELDLIQRGMGVRSARYSMLVVDGEVKSLNVEAPGKFEVSDAETLLKQAEKVTQFLP